MSGRARAAASVLVGAVGAVCSMVCLVACTSSGGSTPAPSRTDLGRVPIPQPITKHTATATPAHPALLEMGAPLRVTLGGARALVVATGPVQSTEYDGGSRAPTRTGGTFSIRISPTAGSLTMRSTDLTSRDETGTPVGLHAVGARTVRATAQRPATMQVRGTYGSGAAQLTWRAGGHVLAVWDFNIELD